MTWLFNGKPCIAGPGSPTTFVSSYHYAHFDIVSSGQIRPLQVKVSCHTACHVLGGGLTV